STTTMSCGRPGWWSTVATRSGAARRTSSSWAPRRRNSRRPMALAIRKYQPEDTAGVRRCVVELQEFERRIDPRLRPGEEMADAYWENMQRRCTEANGQVFVADDGGSVVGFVSVLAAEPFVEIDDPVGTHALITDIVVLPSHRGRRVGAELLQRAEA